MKLKQCSLRIWNLLEDGRPHTVLEVKNAATDFSGTAGITEGYEEGKYLDDSKIRCYISRLRKEVKPYGWRIIYHKGHNADPYGMREDYYILRRVILR